MGKRPIIVTMVFGVVFILHTLPYDIDGIIPYVSASRNSSGQGPNVTISENTANLINDSAALSTLAATNETFEMAEQRANETMAISRAAPAGAIPELVTGLILAIAVMMVIPLLFGMYLSYRQGLQMNKQGRNVSRFGMQSLYRLLVATGVIFAVILIIVYLNGLIAVNSTAPSEVLSSLLETQKNFLTIIGTAFASLVAFYFGTRSRNGDDEKEPAATGHNTTTHDLDVINVNPIDGTVGVEVNSPVMATFSAPVRSSTINTNTFQ